MFSTYDMILSFLRSIPLDPGILIPCEMKAISVQCSKLENQVLTCQGVTVDLKEGLLMGRFTTRLVQSIQGRETKIQELKEQGLSLQLMMPNDGSLVKSI